MRKDGWKQVDSRDSDIVITVVGDIAAAEPKKS